MTHSHDHTHDLEAESSPVAVFQRGMFSFHDSF
jgi:hypothetical protein